MILLNSKPGSNKVSLNSSPTEILLKLTTTFSFNEFVNSHCSKINGLLLNIISRVPRFLFFRSEQ